MNLEKYHMDVETAFLNGNLEVEIFMEIPDGLDIDKNNNKLKEKIEYEVYSDERNRFHKIDFFTDFGM